MAVIGVSRQGLGMQDELATLAALVGRGQRDLDAELIGLVGFAFGDAFGLGRVPGIELPAALALFLAPDLAGLDQRHGEDGAQNFVTFDLAPDIPDHPAQTGAQEFDLAVHALELFGVRVTPDLDRGPFGDPGIGLAQGQAVLLGQLAELLDCHQQQLGVGREGDVLGLHRCIHGDAGQIAFLQGARVMGDAQAFGQQHLQGLADAVAPMAHAGAFMG